MEIMYKRKMLLASYVPTLIRKQKEPGLLLAPFPFIDEQ